MAEEDSSISAGNDFVTEEIVSCTQCKRKCRLIACDGFCLICREYLCEGCAKIHSQIETTKHHIWMDKSKMPIRKVEAFVEDKEPFQEICDVHMKFMIKFFCVTCKKVGCAKCIEETHSTCSDVCYVPDYVKREKWTPPKKRQPGPVVDLSVLLETNVYGLLNSQKEKLKTIKNRLPRQEVAIERYASDVRQRMKEFRKSLEEALDNFEDKIESKIATIGNDDRQMLAIVLRKCEFYEGKFDQLSTKIEANKFNPNNWFVLLQKAKEEGQKFQKDSVYEHLQELVKATKIQFKPEVRSNDDGSIKLGDAMEVKEQYEKAWINEGEVHVFTEDEEKSSKSVSVGAFIVLKNGQLILADIKNRGLRLCKTYENKKENVNDSFILDTVELEANCADIAQVSENHIVVTIPEIKKIQNIGHDGEKKINPGSYIEVEEECFGISLAGKNLAVGFSKKVDIMNLDGTILISTNGDRELNFQFGHPLSITCDNDREIVYIADKTEKAIVAMEFDGTVKAVFREDGMPIPLAVTMGSDGSVLLAADWPFSVQRISPDFVSVESLQTKEDTWDIQCVAYSPVEESLFFSVARSWKILVRDIGIRAPNEY